MKRKAGRPSSYSESMATKICNRMSDGESLRQICRSPGMPRLPTVLRWADDNLEFRDRYARARSAMLEHWAQEILTIADTPRKGTTVTEKPDGTEIKTADMIEHRRLQVDARKWLLSKLAPKKYGDRSALEVSGPDGAPIKSEASVTVDQAAAKYRDLIAGKTS